MCAGRFQRSAAATPSALRQEVQQKSFFARFNCDWAGITQQNLPKCESWRRESRAEVIIIYVALYSTPIRPCAASRSSDLYDRMLFVGSVGMKTGILGGTFDPVHYGHLMVAESCREALSLDQVRFIPARISPHKPDTVPADGHARADMIQLAVAGCPEFVVDRRELRREGLSYTIETLQSLRRDLPDDELFLLLGADSLRQFLSWKDPEQIAAMSTLVVCNRPGEAELTDEQIVEWVGVEIASRVIIQKIPGVDLQASDLRQRALSGQSLRFQTPRAVEAFLTQHRIYADKSTANS